jgi:tRNA(Ser,Leu) C12 N-acetylase TAN1
MGLTMDPAARDWNVVVSVVADGYKAARRLLRALGRVQATGYYNVIALQVDDLPAFLAALHAAHATDAALRAALARVAPATQHFTFQTAAEFTQRARAGAAAFLPQLAGKSFYVRMHRRGFRGALASHEQERLLADSLLGTLAAAGTPGRVRFADPDAIVTVETVGPWAGLALWTRADLERYPLLRPD